MPLTACRDMLAQSVRILWCRAFGHDWTEFGDVRRCRTCETVQHRVVGPGGERWDDTIP
jgi:hypothetical protein